MGSARLVSGLTSGKQKSFSPFLRGLGSRGAFLQLQRSLIPTRCRPLAVSTLGLVEGPNPKHFNSLIFSVEQGALLM